MAVKLHPPRPRKERPENAARRRRQIIEATIDSITEIGLSGTTLASVATRAGVSQGTTVFYFRTKEELFAETLRAHHEEYEAGWRAALDAAPDDPVLKLAAMFMADVDPKICTRRNLALWQAFWGEAKVRPLFSAVADAFDDVHDQVLFDLGEAASSALDRNVWTVPRFVRSADALTDGLWFRMHISPDYLDLDEARAIVRDFFCAAFPGEREKLVSFFGD